MYDIYIYLDIFQITPKRLRRFLLNFVCISLRSDKLPRNILYYPKLYIKCDKYEIIPLKSLKICQQTKPCLIRNFTSKYLIFGYERSVHIFFFLYMEEHMLCMCVCVLHSSDCCFAPACVMRQSQLRMNPISIVSVPSPLCLLPNVSVFFFSLFPTILAHLFICTCGICCTHAGIYDATHTSA